VIPEFTFNSASSRAFLGWKIPPENQILSCWLFTEKAGRGLAVPHAYQLGALFRGGSQQTLVISQ